VREVPGGVGVAVDGEDGSVPEGQPDQVRGKVQAVGEGVDLERDAGAGARREQASQSTSMGARLPMSRVVGGQ
jgi:hypothetical protein